VIESAEVAEDLPDPLSRPGMKRKTFDADLDMVEPFN
jgi:hypothetical protein